jgi:hypothetical protein
MRTPATARGRRPYAHANPGVKRLATAATGMSAGCLLALLLAGSTAVPLNGQQARPVQQPVPPATAERVYGSGPAVPERLESGAPASRLWIGGLLGSAAGAVAGALLSGCMGQLDSPYCWPAMGGLSLGGATVGVYAGNRGQGSLPGAFLGALGGTALAVLIATQVDPDHGGAYVVLAALPVLQTAGAIIGVRAVRRQ